MDVLVGKLISLPVGLSVCLSSDTIIKECRKVVVFSFFLLCTGDGHESSLVITVQPKASQMNLIVQS